MLIISIFLFLFIHSFHFRLSLVFHPSVSIYFNANWNREVVGDEINYTITVTGSQVSLETWPFYPVCVEFMRESSAINPLHLLFFHSFRGFISTSCYLSLKGDEDKHWGSLVASKLILRFHLFFVLLSDSNLITNHDHLSLPFALDLMLNHSKACSPLPPPCLALSWQQLCSALTVKMLRREVRKCRHKRMNASVR